ncbi:condensation domain-containing protein [Catenulispora pinisilvae]|uniref:condensation domain-containing protein n=1 Tax=Catenulispora pinisilvae TaxID=2705253 RepID=UPI0018912575|nr:condensation domain-containing protein [Catenulispora pinisilvae]
MSSAPGAAAAQRLPAAGPAPRSRAAIAQERFWWLEQTNPAEASLHLSGLLRFRGTGLTEEHVAANVAQMVAEQPALRTVFEEVDGELWQVVLPDLPDVAEHFHIIHVDCAGTDDDRMAARMAEAVEIARRLADDPFDLRRGPLFRIAMLVLDPDEFLLLVTAHHLISDGFSISLMGHAATIGSPGPVQVTYLDHAEAQRAQVAAGGYERELTHWKELLRDAPPITTFPLDHPRPAVWSPVGANLTDAVDPALAQRVRSLATRQRRSPGAVLVACYLIVLAGWSGQRDLITATSTLGRSVEGTAGVVGLFRNFAPLRWTDTGAWRFTDLMEHAQRSLYDASDHSELPVAALVAELEPDPAPDRSPLFQTLVNLLLVEDVDYCLPPPARMTGCSLDMMLHIEEWLGTYYLTWLYPTTLLEPDSVATFNASFHTVLRQAVATPQISTEQLVDLVREAARVRDREVQRS